MEFAYKKRAWSITFVLLVVCSFLLSGIHLMIPFALSKQPTRIGEYEIENAYHISEAGRSVKRVEPIGDIKKIDIVNEFVVASTFGKFYSFNTEGAVFNRPYNMFDFEVSSIDEKIMGEFMFRVLGNQTIQLVNMSNIAEPKVLGTTVYQDQITKIEVGWMTLFSVNSSGYFQIRPSGYWDSMPSAAVQLNNNQVTAMVREGRRMYIGTDGGWLFIVSIVSDTTLFLEKSIPTNRPINDIAVYSDLIILGTTNGLYVYNTITDSSFSVNLANIKSINVQNDLIYAACEEYLMVFEIQSTQVISIVTALDFDEPINIMTVDGLFAYVATRSKVYFLKIGEYMEPLMKFKIEGADYTDSECNRRFLYTAESYFNIFQKNGLTLERYFVLSPAKPVDIEIEGNLAFVLLDNSTFQIYNISNAAVAWLIASHMLPASNYKHMKVEFDHVFFASSDGAVFAKLNDVLMLETPSFLNYSVNIVDIATMIGRFIVASPDTITIWDVGSMMPGWLSNIQVQNVRSIEVDYPSLYVGTTNSIKTYNIRDLNNPVLVSDISTGEITDIEVNRDFLVASDLARGMSIFNRSNAYNPIYINSTNTQGGVSLSLSGELAVYTCDKNQYKGIYGYIFMTVGSQILEYLWDDSTGFDWMSILRIGLPILIVVIIVIVIIVKIRRNSPKFKKMSSELKESSLDQVKKVSEDFFDSEF